MRYSGLMELASKIVTWAQHLSNSSRSVI
jgi:hypothetical protein